MLRMPNKVETRAGGVGMQVLKVLLSCNRKSFSGVQWPGRAVDMVIGGSHGMIVNGDQSSLRRAL
jgi:hypothetical protein